MLDLEDVRRTVSTHQDTIDSATTTWMEEYTELWEDALESMDYFQDPRFEQYAVDAIAEAHDPNDEEWIVGTIITYGESNECVLHVATGDVRVRD